jgi:hypothetical protein
MVSVIFPSFSLWTFPTDTLPLSLLLLCYLIHLALYNVSQLLRNSKPSIKQSSTSIRFSPYSTIPLVGNARLSAELHLGQELSLTDIIEEMV